MDKQEYREFLNEIKRAYEDEDYEAVAAYGDAIDPGKLKDVKTLEMISDSYAKLDRNDDALEVLEEAFGRNRESRQIAYKLCMLCIKTGDLDSAVRYNKDYCRLSGNNSKRYLLKYEIGRAGGISPEKLAAVLEKYLETEKSDKWEYELAKLYHECGQGEKCARLCDDICLWFSGGEYVKNALELKFSHVALTPSQQKQYEQIMKDYLEPEERAAIEDSEDLHDENSDDISKDNAGKDNTNKDNINKENTDKDNTDRNNTDSDISLTEEQKDAADDMHVCAEGEGAPSNIQDTKVIPIDDILKELDENTANEDNKKENDHGIFDEDNVGLQGGDDHVEWPDEIGSALQKTINAWDDEEEIKAEACEAEAYEALNEGNGKTISMDQLRTLIQQGNSKAAAQGVFFTYEQPTDEDIAIEKAQKEAREEARRKQQEAKRIAYEEKKRHEAELARMAEEENAAREAAAAAAKESERIERDARIEAEMSKACQEFGENLQWQQEYEKAEEDLKTNGLDRDEEKMLIEEADLILKELTTSDSDDSDDGGFEGLEGVFEDEADNVQNDPQDADAEQNIDLLQRAGAVHMAVALQGSGAAQCIDSETDADLTENEIEHEAQLEDEINEVAETIAGQSDSEGDIGATLIFGRKELDSALNNQIYEDMTPEEKLGEEIRKIITDSNETLEIDMQETRSIRIKLSAASAGKLGVLNARLSQYASSVIKPELYPAGAAAADTDIENGPRIIDNVDFSYISVSSDDSGQLGLDVESLTPEMIDDDSMEGQLSIDDILEELNVEKPDAIEESGVSGVEIERLRMIQSAVNLTSPVVLPYAMDDPMFDDIEISDMDGNNEKRKGDIFAFDPKKIGLVEGAQSSDIPSDIGDNMSEGHTGLSGDLSDHASNEQALSGENAITGMISKGIPTDIDMIRPDVQAEEYPDMSAICAAAEGDNVDITGEVSGCDEGIDTDEPDIAVQTAAGSLHESEAEDAIARFEIMNAEERSKQGLYEDVPDQDEEFGKLMDEFETAGISGASEEEKDEDDILDTDAFDELFSKFLTSSETEDEHVEPESDMVSAKDETLSSGSSNKGKGYILPENIKKEVSEFLLIDGMEEQICKCIGDIIDAKRCGDESGGNLVVTGDIKTGKTYLAIEMIKAISQEIDGANGKVAKVQSELLNGKNLDKVLQKIGGSHLIIENVGYLDDTTVENLINIMKEHRYSGMITLEGNQLAVESLFGSFPELKGMFKNRVDINELSIIEWADIAAKYAKERGYVLDDIAKLALHAKINEINVPTRRLGYDDVIGIIDKAIERAEKRNSGKLFSAFKKNDDVKQKILESDLM